MPAERYLRWHNSNGTDDEQNGLPELEEEFEEECPPEEAGEPQHGRVMTVTPRRATRFNAARRAGANLPLRLFGRLDVSWKTLCLLAASFGVCLALGILLGYSIPTHRHQVPLHPAFSYPPPLAPHSSLPFAPRFGGVDFKQAVAVGFQSHLNSRMVNAYASRLDKISESQLVDYVSSTLSFQGFVTKTTFFSASVSSPDENNPNTVELMHRNRSDTVINQPSLEEGRLPYAAFSPSGAASGRVVYGHLGTVRDLEILRQMGVEINNAILLLRHCSDAESAQVIRAQDAGAVGVLLYPDPQQFGGNGTQYPDGSGLPDDGVLFPSVKVVPGDPTTLHYPSLGHVYKKSHSAEDGIMPKIPAQPISYSTARIILDALAGPAIPEEWRSGHEANSSTNSTHQEFPTPTVAGPPWHKVGGEWTKDGDVVGLSMKVYNVVREKGISNVHAWLPARDPSKVVHIGASLGSRGGAGVGLASLLAIGESMARTLTNGSGRRVMLSAWAESHLGWIGSTEFTELNSEWLESTALAYLSVGDTVGSSLGLRVQATPLLHEAVREAAHSVAWPQQEALSVLEGWRAGHGMEYDIAFENLGCAGDAVSFASRLGVPAVQFSVARPIHPGQCREGNCDPCYDRREEHPLTHSQYDTTAATTEVLDPSLDWTTAMASLVGVTSLVLSESVLPPVDFKGDFSSSLVDGWWSFLHHHVHSLNHTAHNFTAIVDAIRVELYSLQSQMEDVDTWYNKRTNQEDYYARFRHDEDRVSYFLRLSRRLLGPRGIERIFTSALAGPSVLLEDPFHALHDLDQEVHDQQKHSKGLPNNILSMQTNNVFSQSQFNNLAFSSSYKEEDKPRPHSWYPQVSQALTLALEGKGSWETLHKELSLVLSALTAFRNLIPLEN